MTASEVNIFDYTNYRDFLRDFYAEKKRVDGYTYRDFSKRAGMNSSSWLFLLIKGVKNLTPESIIRVGQALDLKKKEMDYFELLVHFTQAKTNDTKNHYYQRMLTLKKKLHMVTITEEQYEYFSTWYHPVIRSLITKAEFGDDYGILGRLCIPSITAREAEKSVELLLRLGFIKKTEDGKYVQSSTVLSTGDEVKHLNMVNYHQEVAKLASESFDRMPADLRDLSSLTMGINKADYERIKEKIREFRKEVMKIAQESTEEDRVCQLNFQLFHVSQEIQRPGHASQSI